MNSKGLITLCTIIGSFLGGCIPLLWGDDGFSYVSLLFSSAGAIAGIYIGYKIGRGY